MIVSDASLHPGSPIYAKAYPSSRIQEKILESPHTYADTSPGLRLGREKRQIDAIHRIPRIEKVMH